MKVRLLTARAGEGFVQKHGDVVDLDEATARRMIASQQAAAVANSCEPIETAAIDGGGETAATHIGQPRGKRRGKTR